MDCSHGLLNMRMFSPFQKQNSHNPNKTPSVYHPWSALAPLQMSLMYVKILCKSQSFVAIQEAGFDEINEQNTVSHFQSSGHPPPQCGSSM